MGISGLVKTIKENIVEVKISAGSNGQHAFSLYSGDKVILNSYAQYSSAQIANDAGDEFIKDIKNDNFEDRGGTEIPYYF